MAEAVDSQRQRSVEFLDEASDEARRNIGGEDFGLSAITLGERLKKLG